MCLPRYNAEGFLYVYVSFINGDDAAQESSPAAGHSSVDSSETLPNGGSTSPTHPVSQTEAESRSDEVSLVIVTAQRDDFEKVHSWASTIETVSVAHRATARTFSFPCILP